jgi:hypothetical protein
MASALCTALFICLTKADSCVEAMVADVKMRTRDGYKVVWNLLYQFVPGFDPTKTVDKPCWDKHSRDVINYAVAFGLYFWLSAKRGENHNQFTRLILFLKGITARNLMKIMEPLLIAIKGTQRNLNNIGGTQIGYLPHHLHVSALAQRIAKCCKVKPFDRDLGGHPWVHNLTYGDDLSTSADNSDEYASQYAGPLDGHMQGYLVPTVAQAQCLNGLPGRWMPNTTYSWKPDPTQRMQPDQPCVTCEACGKTGHVVNLCNFLAMSVFLQQHLKNGIATKATIADAEHCWIERWKARGGSPTTTPSKVHTAFAEQSGLTFEQMEDEMDWLCWPATLME